MTIAGAAEAHRTILALGMEVAAVGTFISVGIKLPYFAFWGGKKEYTGKIKPLPVNMYVGMAICGLLCIAQGVYPHMLYKFLPFAVEHQFEPWHLDKVINSGLLLGFSGLAFYLTRNIITPHSFLNLDFDWFYRLIGRVTMRAICWPASKIDDVWTEVYRTVGLRALIGAGDGTSVFDKKGIDTVVDGSAYTVRYLGRVGAKAQTARLQDYLAFATVLGLGIFAWYGTSAKPDNLRRANFGLRISGTHTVDCIPAGRGLRSLLPARTAGCEDVHHGGVPHRAALGRASLSISTKR